MSYTNDNGLIVTTIPYTSQKPYLSEGAIIGISFGWIVGSILLYVLGMLLIKFCFKRYYEESENSSSNQPRKRKPSSSSSEGQGIKGGNAHSRRQQESRKQPNVPERGKRRPYEENPTIQHIKVTEQNASSTYKHIKSIRPAAIQLQLHMDERIQPHQN